MYTDHKNYTLSGFEPVIFRLKVFYGSVVGVKKLSDTKLESSRSRSKWALRNRLRNAQVRARLFVILKLWNRFWWKTRPSRINKIVAEENVRNRWLIDCDVDRWRRRVASQGCQMVYFETQNTNLGKFWKVLQWKIYMPILSILRPTGIFCGHLVHLVVIWYIFPTFGKLHWEKSGNPVASSQ
jgi:hypothetical protein